MEIGARIRHARQAAGLSQAQLAAMMGVTRSACSQWESLQCMTVPRYNRLVDIAKYLGVSYTWLVSGEFHTAPRHLPTDNTLSGRQALPLTSEQSELLTLYSHLPVKTQQALLQVMRSILANNGEGREHG